MSTDNADGTGIRILPLPPILDMAAASELKLALEAALTIRAGIRIEAGDVQRVGTPGLQVLIAAAKSFHAHGTDFGFGDCAPAFTDAARALGLGAALGIDGD